MKRLKTAVTVSVFALALGVFAWSGRMRLSAPVYTAEGGWYEDSVTVGITGSGGRIYYTTDGSDPDETSALYTGPITLDNRSGEDNIYSAVRSVSVVNDYIPDYKTDKCTVLKSVEVKNGRTGPVRSETYFIDLKGDMYDVIPTVSLSVSPADLFGDEKGIYVTGDEYRKFYEENGYADEYEHANYAMRGRDWERKAEIEYFSEDHRKIFEQQIGIRIHGGSSRALNQKSFNLYARREYDGNENFIYDPLNDSSEGVQKDRFVLRSGGDVDLYVTKMRDVLLQSFVSDRDIGTADAVPCNVFLNGEYWGLYNLQEAINETYLKEHYGVDPGRVILLKNGRSNMEKPDAVSLYDDMVSFAAGHDLSQDENYRQMEEMIDIQSCIDYYAAQVYSANPDSFANNLAAWRTDYSGSGPYDDGRWRWILLDMDEGAALKTEFSSAEINSFREGNYWGSLIGDDALFTALISNSEFRERFVSSFNEMMEVNYRYSSTSKKLEQMAALYKSADVASQRRFRGDFTDDGYFPGEGYTPPYTEEDFDSDVKVIDDFLRDRSGYIRDYLEKEFGASE